MPSALSPSCDAGLGLVPGHSPVALGAWILPGFRSALTSAAPSAQGTLPGPSVSSVVYFRGHRGDGYFGACWRPAAAADPEGRPGWERTYLGWALAPGIPFLAVSQHLLYLFSQLLQDFKQGQRGHFSAPPPLSLPPAVSPSFSSFSSNLHVVASPDVIHDGCEVLQSGAECSLPGAGDLLLTNNLSRHWCLKLSST